MSHVRTQIRNVFAALVEGATDLTGRVVADPTEVKDADAGPWIEVAIGSEQIQPRTLGNTATGRRLTRQLPLFAEIHTRGKGEAIEQYETIAAAIEAKVFANPRLGGLLLTPMTLALLEPQNPDLSGSLPRHTLRMQWNSAYSTAESNATAAIASS